MVIINHNTDRYNIFKEVAEQPHIFLGNRNGNYLLMSDIPKSRYDGFFFFNNFRMFRILEHIELLETPKIAEIDNNFFDVGRRRGHLKERFFMPFFFNSLVYEVSEISKINLYFDVKEAFDNREWGRNYIITEEKDGIILLKFIKTSDSREDADDSRKEYELYIAIKPDIKSYERVDSWVERNYSRDGERNSEPSKRAVYLPFEFKAGRLVISVSMNKAHALEECSYIFNNLHKVEKEHAEHFRKTAHLPSSISDRHIETAYLCAHQSLHALLLNIPNKHETRMLAGLPWFFQVWSRDELISLKAWLLTNHTGLAKNILFSNLEQINYEGRLTNAYPPNNLGNADSIGWLFRRVHDLLIHLERNKKLDAVTKSESDTIKEKLEHAMYLLIKYHTKDLLDYNESLETWMDTKYSEADNGRAGARIEIQALRLQSYHLLHKLTKSKEYLVMEKKLLKVVRERFWTGKYLLDGFDDATIRPNAFIAAYVYPRLLSRKEWIECFKYMLPRLWLPWGGLSTIDKFGNKFTKNCTGENPKSYHHGDSWFWINNLAALVLHRLGHKEFQPYTDKILKASTHEILWQGAIGCHAEVSSAVALRSDDSLVQAWSNAMFIELVHEISNKKLVTKRAIALEKLK